MKKFIIKYNSGYGDTYEEVEAEKEAYDIWRQEVEENADYEVVGESTQELRDDYL